MKTINIGTAPNDGTGDSILIACRKINDNFNIIEEKLKLNAKLKVIIWKDLKDTKKAMENINYNFETIFNSLSF